MLQRLAEMRIPANADRLGLIRAVVKRAAEKCGFQAEMADQLVIAVNEACMNVIQHAYQGDESGEIVLEIFNNGEQICFRLEDSAPPMDLARIRPRDLDDVRPGGLGTHFIRSIMDDCTMGHLEGDRGNYLEMTKKLEPE